MAARVTTSEPADHAHIDRWLNSAGDPVWKIKRGLSQEIDYVRIVTMGLMAREAAEHAEKTGQDPIYDQLRGARAYYLKLAESAEYLAKEFANSRHELSRELEKESGILREIAAEIPKPMYLSRQAGGKKRARFRMYGAFMSLIINTMRKDFGRPHYHFVVAMTNIAFPEADITEEDARSVWRATAGLRRRDPRSVHSEAD